MKKTAAVLCAAVLVLCLFPLSAIAAGTQVVLPETEINLFDRKTFSRPFTVGHRSEVKLILSDDSYGYYTVSITSKDGGTTYLKKEGASAAKQTTLSVKLKTGQYKAILAVDRGEFFYGYMTVKATPIVTETDPLIAFGKASYSVRKGLKVTPSLTVQPKNGVLTGLTFKSSNPKIARVSQKGVVTGVSKGTATVTASIKGQSVSCRIKVKNPVLSLSNLELAAKQRRTLTVKGGTGTIRWKSANKAVATVSQKGVVTAIKVGKTTVTAVRSGVTMRCTVTVKKPSVTLSKTALTLYVNKTVALTKSSAALVARLSIAGGSVAWKSSNTAVATVKKGVVTAVNKGTATVTVAVTYADKTYKASCAVTVKEKAGVSFSDFDWKIGKTGGVTPQMTATNNTVKAVKKLTFTLVFMDAQGNPLQDRETGCTAKTVNVTLLLEAGGVGEIGGEVMFRNPDVRKVQMKDLEILYEDGTEETHAVVNTWSK